MKDVSDRELLRLVTGECEAGEVARLERAIEDDPALRRRRREWRELWASLELPAPEPGASVLPALRSRLAAEGGTGSGASWPLGPLWGRALAAAALTAGIALGAWWGGASLATVQTTSLGSYQPSLAESYWTEVEEGDLTLGGK